MKKKSQQLLFSQERQEGVSQKVRHCDWALGAPRVLSNGSGLQTKIFM